MTEQSGVKRYNQNIFGHLVEDINGELILATDYDDLAAERDAARAEVVELKESLHLANGTADLAMKHRDAAEGEIKRLRGVLEWYAEADYSRSIDFDTDGNAYVTGPSEVDRDFGCKARAALRPVEEQGEEHDPLCSKGQPRGDQTMDCDCHLSRPERFLEQGGGEVKPGAFVWHPVTGLLVVDIDGTAGKRSGDRIVDKVPLSECSATMRQPPLQSSRPPATMQEEVSIHDLEQSDAAMVKKYRDADGAVRLTIAANRVAAWFYADANGPRLAEWVHRLAESAALTHPAPATELREVDMSDGATPKGEHGKNCDIWGGENCSCGLHWRNIADTEQTMHAAWRKRAEQAEVEADRLRTALAANAGVTIPDRLAAALRRLPRSLVAELNEQGMPYTARTIEMILEAMQDIPALTPPGSGVQRGDREDGEIVAGS